MRDFQNKTYWIVGASEGLGRALTIQLAEVGAKVIISARNEERLIELSEEIIKEDKTIIEDLIVAAHNSAKSQLKTKTTEEISKATGGFGIPGFKWPL